ncbi:DUF6497 family protein [Aquicoccus sp. G2-2]|uniref:DUF6497 family protein n=1 Tax=Aquicoccus sp. G2-2 TaxID=3092120 RepID=UPI002ADF6C7D|nr:DUF6497 family protein [Aquicoccus sp. G2-2]MEA1112893.1 DUF6497 family protein [Aquicoccus sp. G2-2]
MDELPAFTLPSGLPATLQEIIRDEKPDGMFTYLRFRFVAPGLKAGAAKDFEARATDLAFLCNGYALSQVSNRLGPDEKIVISLSDRETEFGAPDADAVQIFETYHVENGACIWEDF